MKKEDIKCGDIRVAMQQENILWMDRKRIPVLGLPWSFTKYSMTPSRLTIESGLFNKRERMKFAYTALKTFLFLSP